MCVHIAQLMTHPAMYTIPIVKRFIYQFMMDCKNFITSNLLYIGPMVSHYILNSSNNQPIYLLRITIIYSYIYKWRRLHEENYKHMKIVVGILEVSSSFIFYSLFGIPLLIYFCHSSQVICKILRLWYRDPLYPYIISFYNYN